MEFYKRLTNLLKSARALQKLDLYKNVEHKEKEKLSKEFINKLISFLECKVISEQGKKFRIYWICYLDKLINSILQYCSNDEFSKINNLKKEVNEEKENFLSLKEENNKNDIEKYKIEDKNIKKEKNNGGDLDKIEERKINFNELKLENIKEYYPKKYKDNLNKNPEKTSNIPEIFENNKKGKEEKQNKINFNNEELNNNFMINNNNFAFFEDDKDIIINNEEKKEKKGNKEKLDKNNMLNLDNLKYQSDEKIMKNREKLSEINEKIIHDYKKNNLFKDFNNNNNNINNIPQENIKIQNINANKKEEENKLKPKKQKSSDIKDKPKLSKQEKEIAKIEEQCNELLNNKNNNNIIKIIFSSLFNQNNNEDNFNNSMNNINNKSTQLFNFIKKCNNKKINLSQSLKEKLITLVCILYPFSKGNKSIISENIFVPEASSDKRLYDYLKKSILIKPPEEFKFVEYNEKTIPNSINNFCIDLKINSIYGKYEIYNAFMFLVLLRNLRKYENKENKNYFDFMLEKEYFISFKLRFILEHQDNYLPITEDFLDIYKGLHFIKIFYDEIFSETKIIQKDGILDNYIFGKTKFILSLDESSDFDIQLLFKDKEDKDNLIYEGVFQKVEYFYHIDKYFSPDIYNLINYSSNKYENPNINFILNLVDLEQKKIEYIYGDFKKYKGNLFSLEKDIFRIGKEALNLNNNTIARYFINKGQKDVFNSLLINIKKYIKKTYREMFDLYPYGSVTQFLGNKKSDIDIYLYVKNIHDDNEKFNLLEELRKAISNIIGREPRVIISTRLCVIKFTYGQNRTDFDISITGFCPYLHSILFRTYSLIDPRFSLLSLALKKFIEILGLKNQENKNEYLNSFSWMILLITFLQDIIKPPILPKLLSDKNNSIDNIPIQYGKNFIKNKDYKYNNNLFYQRKNIKSFIQNIREENTQIPSSFFDEEKSLYSIFKEKNINKSGENKLTCAELFLSFLEFIIYYFKYDTIYVNCSIENEGFEPMKNIINFGEQNERNKKDERFYDYFKRYCRQRVYKEEKTITRDGLILIRDPFDPHYNPGHTLNRGYLNKLINNLKFGYLSLIKYGKFEILEKEIKEKEKIERKNDNSAF